MTWQLRKGRRLQQVVFLFQFLGPWRQHKHTSGGTGKWLSARGIVTLKPSGNLLLHTPPTGGYLEQSWTHDDRFPDARLVSCCWMTITSPSLYQTQSGLLSICQEETGQAPHGYHRKIQVPVLSICGSADTSSIAVIPLALVLS